MARGLVSGPCHKFTMAASLTAQSVFFAGEGAVLVQTFATRVRAWAVSLLTALGVALAGQVLAQDETGEPEESAAPAAGAMNDRPMFQTGVGEHALSQSFPEAALWLELDEGERALGLFYPETRLPSQGALVVLSDVGETAASGITAPLARHLAARGWAVLSLGLEMPSPGLQRVLERPTASSPDTDTESEPADPSQAQSVMIDVMAPAEAEDLEARYRGRINQALGAALAELVERGYQAPVLLGIGQAAGHVTNRALESGDASAVIWVAPRFYPADRAALAERLQGGGTPVLELYPARDRDGAVLDRYLGQQLRRAEAASFQRQPIPWFSPPAAPVADAVASRVSAWLGSR